MKKIDTVADAMAKLDARMDALAVRRDAEVVAFKDLPIGHRFYKRGASEMCEKVSSTRYENTNGDYSIDPNEKVTKKEGRQAMRR